MSRYFFIVFAVTTLYVILLVTFFVANQIVSQNVSRPKILIAWSGKA